MSPETRFLVQRLQKTAPGEIAYYSDLSEAIGCENVRDKEHRSKLSRAITIAKRDYGLLFTAIPDVGYQLLKQSDVAMIAESKGIADHNRATKSWFSKLDTVDYGLLDEVGKKSYSRSCTRASIVAAATDEKAFKLLESRLPTTNQFKQSKEDILAAIAYGVS